MKPKRILLIRHGQSISNVDKQVYTHTPDYAVTLTDKGRAQAKEVGEKIYENMGIGDGLGFYISPYFRTRETYLGISGFYKERGLDDKIKFVYEDPRLREEEWLGKLRTPDAKCIVDIEKERDKYGTFYYRFDGGESCADVYNRVSGFLDTLFRDFEKPSFPSTAVIVSHGMTLRVLLMRWFHWSVEEFEVLKNPKNCCCIQLNRTDAGKYVLSEPLEKWPTPTHPYQMPL